MWFGREIAVLHPLPACPCPSSLLLNRITWKCWDLHGVIQYLPQTLCRVKFCVSEVGARWGHTQVGFGAALLQTGKSEGKIRRKEGRILRESQFLWSVLKAGAVWAAVSPQPAQRCLLTSFRTCLWRFLLELFSLEAGNSCCRMCENPGELMVGECQWERSRIWKVVAKGRNSPFWISVGSKGEPLHPKICHQRQGGFLKHFLINSSKSLWGSAMECFGSGEMSGCGIQDSQC